LGWECFQYQNRDASRPESKVCVTDGPDRASLIESGSVRGCRPDLTPSISRTLSFRGALAFQRTRDVFSSERTNRSRSSEGGIHSQQTKGLVLFGP
jgi:hypothetical protein